MPRVVQGLSALGRRAAGGAAPRDLGDRIAAAGRPGGLGVREVMAAKAAAAVLTGIIGAMLSVAAPGRLGVLVIALAPAAGFLAPDLWLSRRARARGRSVRRELPALLDMLRVTVDAGASLTAAMSEVGARARGTLATEWRAVGQEAALGVPLSDALEGMRRRLPQPEVEALVGALDRARRHGAPLGATLARQARDCRAALRRAVQEEAAKASPKIQLVVALLLVPSVLLMVAAALAAALLDSGGVPGS
ncbi:MAG TPA: type II secretion system F family protein [Thermoanaerobaculia bacterium]